MAIINCTCREDVFFEVKAVYCPSCGNDVCSIEFTTIAYNRITSHLKSENINYGDVVDWAKRSKPELIKKMESRCNYVGKLRTEILAGGNFDCKLFKKYKAILHEYTAAEMLLINTFNKHCEVKDNE